MSLKSIVDANVVSFRRIEIDDWHPDGEWPAMWSGYLVKWQTERGAFEGRSDAGVGGIDVPCRIRFEKGKAMILPATPLEATAEQ